MDFAQIAKNSLSNVKKWGSVMFPAVNNINKISQGITRKLTQPKEKPMVFPLTTSGESFVKNVFNPKISQSEIKASPENVFTRQSEMLGLEKQKQTGIIKPEDLAYKKELQNKLGSDYLQAEMTGSIQNVGSKLGSGAKKLIPQVDDILNPKNFDNVDDYIKAQGTLVYHGTNIKNAEMIKNKPRLLSVKEHQQFPTTVVGDTQIGISSSKDKSIAEYFASLQPTGKGEVVDIILPKNAKIYKLPDNINSIDNLGLKELQRLKKDGYDAIEDVKNIGGESEIRILSPEKIKTKSQLIEEWNKANQSVDTVKGNLPKSNLPFPQPKTSNELASNAKALYSNQPKIKSAFDLANRFKKGEIEDKHLWMILSSKDSPFSVNEAHTIYESMGIDPMGGYPFKPLSYKISKEKLAEKIKTNLFKDKYGFPLSDIEISKLGKSPDDIIKLLEKPQSVDTNIGKWNIKSVDKKQPEKSLMALHNLTANNYMKSKEIGGIANPSVGIVDINKGGLEGFGEITLVGDSYLPFSGKAKTMASDIYSPRFPSTETRIKDFRIIDNKLKQFEDITGEKMYNIDTSDIKRSLENSPLTRASFVKENGLDTNKTLFLDDYNKYTKDIVQKDESTWNKYESYVDNIVKEAGGEDRIFKGFTYSGRKQTIPLTAENASKMMNKESLRGGENFMYGLGNIRAEVAPELKNIASIKKNKDKLVSKEEFKNISEKYSSKLDDILEKIDKYNTYRDSNRFIESSNIQKMLGEYITGRDSKYFLEKFKNIPNSLLKEIDTFKNSLKEMPTEYFETKFKRVVQPGEFKHAVIPDDTPQNVIKEMERDGLEILKYKSGDETDRLKKLMSLKGKMAFSLLLGMLGIGTLNKQDKK